MENELLKIGVTGSAGSGKSAVCEGFGRLGLVTLDCDRIAREVVEPGREAYKEVVAAFGPAVVSADGGLDRARLRALIVERPEMRKRLEGILHPVIIREMVRRMEAAGAAGAAGCAVEVPLLFELGMEGHFDAVVVVTAPEERLVERIAARDGVDRSGAEKMLALQMGQDEKVRRADHVILNRGSREALFRAVALLHEKLVKERLTKKK